MHHLKKLLPQKKSKQQRKGDGAQTSSVPHAGPSANQLAAPLDPTARPSSAPPIGWNEYEANHSESTEPLPSTPHITTAVQGSNEPVLPHLNLAAPRTVIPYNTHLILDDSNHQPRPVAQAGSALQDVEDSPSLHSDLAATKVLSRNSSAADNPILRLPSPTSPTATLQGSISSPDKLTQDSAQPGGMKRAFTVGRAMLKTLGVVAGVPTLDDFVESLEHPCLTKKDLEKYCGRLLDTIRHSLEEEGSKMPLAAKNSLDELYRKLLEMSDEIRNAEDGEPFIEYISLKMTQAIESYRLANDIAGVITAEKHDLRQFVEKIPRVEASYDDYGCKKQSGPCFGRTRESLIADIETWITTGERSQMYMLSGLAGIGKSTVAFTIADRAKAAGRLGASFFFSRDETERSNAKRVFTTIAFQLCVYNEEFARAIGTVLRDENGVASTTKDTGEQMEVFILKPLRDIVRSSLHPVVVVIDALDECEDKDAMEVLTALTKLVQELPSFRVVLTTRPQPHLPTDPSVHRVFHLQNIDEKIVDDDIRLYLEHSLSQEQVARCLPGLLEQWSASTEEIAFLVRTAGRLFIIVSTAVRFILDDVICDPKSQMETLKTDGRISLDGLESFYLVILRHAVPYKCKPMVVQRFKAVVGMILVIQMPLPIGALARLAHPRTVNDIHAVLRRVQSVIMVNKDTPQIYHKSFFDFLTNADHCTEDLLIDLRVHHTQIAMHCFQIMNKDLKRNILDLGDPARFMNNAEGLAAQGISEDQLYGKIPTELRYACIYWINHIEGADSEDKDIVKECEKFTSEHLLHWLETLSWIGKLDIAHRALRSVQKLLRFSSPDMREMVTDTFRLVSKFYKVIKRSALHTYHSALIFTPMQRLLYQKHCEEMTHKACWLQGGPAQWDPLVASFIHPKAGQDFSVRFSRDSSKLASLTSKDIRFWDAMSGTPISAPNLEGSGIVLADDFSIVAVPRDRIIKLYDATTNTPLTLFTPSSKVTKLALSHDGSRLAAALSNNTISLWDVQKRKSIAILGGASAEVGQLLFSPSNHILASRLGGEIRLWNGSNGQLIASLDYESEEHIEFVFSHNGSRLASLTKKCKARTSLSLWNGENGSFIGAAKDVGDVEKLAISDGGSFLAAASGDTVNVWSGYGGNTTNTLSPVDTIDVGMRISLAFSRELLAIASYFGDVVMLYDIRSCTIISTLQFRMPIFLSISLDSTRLAAGNHRGDVSLWDIANIKASNPASIEQSNVVWALAFSPGCSRLAAGFFNGTVKLWNTDQVGQPIATHKLHSENVSALAFSPDDEQLASGSWDSTVRVWDGRDGSTSGIVKHAFADSFLSVAFSSFLLAAATHNDIAIWDRKTLCLIDVINFSSLSLPFSYDYGVSLSFSEGGSSLAVACEARRSNTSNVTVWDMKGRTAIATFEVDSTIRNLTLSPDGSQVFIEIRSGDFLFFDVSTGNAIKQTGCEDLGWIPNLNGIPISWKPRVNYLTGRFSEHHEHISLLYFPTELGISSVTVGSSMFAVGCGDGRILLVQS